MTSAETAAVTLPGLALLGLAAALLAPACTDDEPPDDPIRAYLIDTWGITTTGFDDWDGTQFVIEDDGTAVSVGEGTIHVAGLGSKALALEAQVAPQSQGGETTVFISLLDAPEEIYMAFDPALGRLSFGDEQSGMGIDAQPDGTFRVWRYVGDSDVEETLAVTDGVGSYQHVEANGGLEDESPHLLLMAFALGQSPAYEARTQVKCNADISRVASAPVPCDVFRTFCECVACHALDGVGCAACPILER